MLKMAMENVAEDHRYMVLILIRIRLKNIMIVMNTMVIHYIRSSHIIIITHMDCHRVRLKNKINFILIPILVGLNPITICHIIINIFRTASTFSTTTRLWSTFYKSLGITSSSSSASSNTFTFYSATATINYTWRLHSS